MPTNPGAPARATLRRWRERASRTVILAARKPHHYILTVSTAAAGVFSSLEASDPVKRGIDALPVVTNSDWLGFVLFTVVIAGGLRLLSLAVGRLAGREPIDVLAGLIDESGLLPDLTSHYGRRMTGDTDATPQLDYRVRHLDDRDLDTLCQINREAFARSGFATPLDVIRQRNLSVHQVNPLSYSLIEAAVDGSFVPVGFSCILPLNRLGEASYCRTGGLTDAQLRGIHLTRPGEWSDAVVLFSVGLLRGFRGRLGASPLTISQIFIDHLAEVLLDVHAADPARPTTRIYAQTEHTGTGVARLLNAFGFADTGVVTGDGYPLQMLEIPLGTIDPASVPSAPALRALLEQLRSAAG
ncbi:hypothetical protein [Nocardia asteroides]|uniref:hypothetical protein n=1 Tax=Nocardia asteroides TaxID=1824 RepID=UPI000309F8C9|nr:hypothetical protein [Nocardia asteroides]TLF67032.1 hypothetical protein FEK33_13580 [Nocardia asteroides NBRC 15531]UGT51702.1 hypothetical protein LT345_14600 [Nocardia asteroides]SFM19223.1 hypothetical protein SAMN05444423_102176 [Nocardia asteroides]VEG35393.1 Uncharacterised protein [Nocardia asteroides]